MSRDSTLHNSEKGFEVQKEIVRALISCRGIIRDFILTCQDPLPGAQGNCILLAWPRALVSLPRARTRCPRWVGLVLWPLLWYNLDASEPM